MAYDPGDIKVFNPNKEIAKEITLEILIRHRDALKQARTGELPGVEIENLKDNDRKMNQARALNLIVSAQREMITASRPIIKFTSYQKWKKKYKDEKEQEEHPFEKEDNDYNKMIGWLNFLIMCEKEILNAEKSKKLDDDFLLTKVNNSTGEEVNELTENFYDMLNDLESSYEDIYLIMLINKIVSAGIEEDEELSYKEKEQEAIRRVVEA
jgi:hypothetical protein